MGKDKDKARAYSRAWKAKNKERIRVYNIGWRAKFFSVLKNRIHVYERNKKWRDLNREKIRAEGRAWKAANPDKTKAHSLKRQAKLKGRSLSPWLVIKLFIKQNFKCAYCQTKLKKKDFEKDHIYPLSADGTHTDDNIQILCWDCNRTKGKRSPVEHMQMIGMLPWPTDKF